MKHLILMVILFGCSGIAWATTENAKLTASDGAADDSFGGSLSIDRDTAVVGALYDDDAGDDSGSAYVFTLSGGTWTEQQKLTASDAAAGDRFGGAVSIDGDTAVIGAYNDDDAGSRSGSAYVFTRTGGVWTERQKLTASDAQEADIFGCSVSVNGDTAVIGAMYSDDPWLYSGSAYVFTRNGKVWAEQQKLTASDAGRDHYFGRSVSIDGDTAVIGTLNHAAYVFTRTGGSWTQQQILTASDPVPNGHFGGTVSIDRDTAVIGTVAYWDVGYNPESAYVFTRTGGVWTEQQKLTASDAALEDHFACTVAVNGDTAVIGAYRDDDAGDDSGSAYVFTRTGGVWTEQQKLTASDAAADEIFGTDVSIDGDTAVISARWDDDNGTDSGSAYVFTGIGTVLFIDGFESGTTNAWSATVQ